MDTEQDKETLWKQYEASLIMKGLEDVKAGRTVDGESAIRAVREKYKIPAVDDPSRPGNAPKAERNAAYLKKLEQGLAQVHAGQGIVRSMEELEAMADNGK